MKISRPLRGVLAASLIAFGASAAQAADIVDVAVGSDNHKTLVAALQAAGLVETLQGKGPFTVFAPTDEAFAKLPEGTVESLLKPENKEQLIAVLSYHVVPGAVYADSLVGQQLYAETVQGQSLLASGVAKNAIFVSNGPNNNSSEKAKVLAQIGRAHV